jgi:autotransporter-associated beta strand protein
MQPKRPPQIIMNNAIPARETTRAPRARRLLAAPLLLLCGLPSAPPARAQQAPVIISGTRDTVVSLSSQYGTSYEVLEDAVVTWTTSASGEAAIRDMAIDTQSWTIRNSGTIGAPANGASPYNGILLKTTQASTIINEATGHITTGAVTGTTRAAVNFLNGWGRLVNRGVIIGGANGVLLGNGGVVENTGTIIGQYAGRAGIWVVTGGGTVLNTGGHIEGATGIRVLAGEAMDIHNTGGGVIRGAANGVYGYVSLSVTNGAGSLIEGLGSGSNDTGIYVTNAAALTLLNAGTVSGLGKGIQVGALDGHSIVNEAGGVIKNTGEPSSGTPGALVQSSNSAVRRMTVVNAGLIDGVRHGIYALNEAVIHNTGTIRATGTAAAAVYFASTNSADSVLTLDTGSVIDGDVLSASALRHQIVLQGSGVEDGSFLGSSGTTGFRSLAMQGDDWALAGNISLTGTAAALDVAGGTLSLSGTVFFRNAAGGALVARDATLRLADGASLDSSAAGRNASISNDGEVLFDNTADMDYNGGITGAGAVRKTGPGTLTLGGANDYGDTIVESGTLKGGLGGGVLTVRGGAAYDAGAAAEVRVSGLAGDGAITLGPAADLVFVADAGASAFSFAGTLNGGNRLVKTGSGALDLQQTLTMSNGAWIQDGVLRLDDAAKLGAGALTLGGAATRGLLDHTGAGDWTKDLALAGAGGGFLVSQGTLNFTGAAAGAAIFVKAGAGALDLTAADMTAHTGGVAVDAGTLRGDTAAISGDAVIAAGATLEFHQAAAGSHAGVISGSGSLLKTGAGDLTLAGPNTHGDTLIGAGLLEGNIGLGTLTIETGGTYRMASGQTAPLYSAQGAGVIDLNGNALLLRAADGATETFAFTGAMTGGDTFEKTGGGTTVLTATLGLGHARIEEGVLRLAGQAQLDTGAAGSITLGGASTRGLIEYTDAASADWTKNIGLAAGGGGFIIDQTLVHFTGTAAGDGDFVKAGAGALDITAADMTAHTGGVAVDAGTLRGDTDAVRGDAVIAAGATLEFHQAVAGSHAGVISGSGSLHKTGDGALTLTGPNTYGDTLVSAGLLEGNIGAGALTVAASGTYKMAAGSTAAFTGIGGGGMVDLNGNDLRFDVAAGVTGTFGGGVSLSDAGLFIKTGAGVLDLQKTLSMTGGAFIRDGAVRLDDAAKLGAAAVTLGGAATLGMIDYTGAADFAKTINLDGAGGGFVIDGAGNSAANFTGSAIGAGDFAKSGAGTLDITAADMTAHTGGVRVDGGVLRGDTAVITGDAVIAAGATLEFYQTAAGGYAGVISGSGALLKTGAGELDLGQAAHTYGDTIVERGVLVGTIGSGVLTIGAEGVYRVRDGQEVFTAGGIVGTGTLDLNQADLVFAVAGGDGVFNFSGRYAGAGGNRLVKTGAGALDLQSPAVLPGAAAIEEGVVRLADEAFLGAAIVLGSGSTQGFLEYTGGSAWTKPVEIAAGGGGFTVSGSGEARFAGAVSGAGAFIKEGAGRLDATGADFAAAAGIVARAGTLAGDARSLGAAASVAVDAGAALEFAQPADDAWHGAVAGAGDVYKTGAGVLTLMRALENTGGVSVRAGVLRAGAPGVWLSAASVAVSPGAALDMGGFSQTVAALANDGEIIFNATVNSVAGVVYDMDSLRVTGSATGGGKIRVRLSEAALDGAGAVLGKTFLEITGAGAAPDYAAELDGRRVSGAYEWVISRSEDRKIHTLSAGALSPEVPALGGIDGAGYLAGRSSLAGVSRRLLAERAENVPHDFQLWAGGLWSEDKLNDALYHHARARTTGLQLGGDWNNKKDSETPVAIGAFYDRIGTDMDLDGKVSSAKAVSKGAGFYASYRPGPYYFEAVLRASREDFDIIVPGTPVFSTEGASIAASVEAGGVMPLDWDWKIEPQLQGVLQKHKVDHATDSFGREYTINSADTIEGRFGVRLWREFVLWGGRGRLAFYVQPSLVYEWGGEGVITLTDPATGKTGAYDNRMGGSYGAADTGAVLTLGRHCMINLHHGWHGGAKMHGYAFDASLSLLW